MHPNFHSILYDFFIKGHELNYIAATYESSWYEVAEVLDSELARKYMRSAIRVQNIRAAGINLRSRLAAIKTLESTITERDDRSHSSTEARRRAATAILSGTTPRQRTSRPPRAPHSAHARTASTPSAAHSDPSPQKQEPKTTTQSAKAPKAQRAPVPAPSPRRATSKPTRAPTQPRLIPKTPKTDAKTAPRMNSASCTTHARSGGPVSTRRAPDDS